MSPARRFGYPVLSSHEPPGARFSLGHLSGSKLRAPSRRLL